MGVRERIMTILLMNKIVEEPEFGESLGIETAMKVVRPEQGERNNSHA